MTNVQGGGLAGGPIPTRPQRPIEVERSVRLWWNAIGLALLADVLGLVLPQHTAVINLFLPTPFSGQTHLTTDGIIRFLIFALIDFTIWSLLVRATGRGSNTARWWLTVLAAIEELVDLLGVVSGFYQPTIASVAESLVNLVVFGTVLLAIVAMHKPGAQIYFERLT
ncbi:MAG TPA: hypothetical protein VJ914_21600 [Pseudonocardiaceae bacterium]|nr:hypothetical protein [Pseudonocardiaceae bacterium]